MIRCRDLKNVSLCHTHLVDGMLSVWLCELPSVATFLTWCSALMQPARRKSTKSPLRSANAADAGALGHGMEHGSDVHHASTLTPQPQTAIHLRVRVPPLRTYSQYRHDIWCEVCAGLPVRRRDRTKWVWDRPIACLWSVSSHLHHVSKY